MESLAAAEPELLFRQRGRGAEIIEGAAFFRRLFEPLLETSRQQDGLLLAGCHIDFVAAVEIPEFGEHSVALQLEQPEIPFRLRETHCGLAVVDHRKLAFLVARTIGLLDRACIVGLLPVFGYQGVAVNDPAYELARRGQNVPAVRSVFDGQQFVLPESGSSSRTCERSEIEALAHSEIVPAASVITEEIAELYFETLDGGLCQIRVSPSFDLLLHGLERQIVFGNLTENIIYVLGFGGRAQEQRRRKHGHSFHFFSSFSLKIS